LSTAAVQTDEEGLEPLGASSQIPLVPVGVLWSPAAWATCSS
jgi:hypothetical protein